MERLDDIEAIRRDINAFAQLKPAEVKSILTKLNNLPQDPPQDPNQVVENLRKELVEIIARENAQEDQAQYARIAENQQPLERRYFTVIFKTQLLLAKYWFRNRANNQGQPEDPILRDDFNITDDDVVALSNGFLYKRTSLNDYFSRGNAFRANGRLVDAVTNECYTTREIASMRNQGVTVPIPNRRFVHVLGRRVNVNLTMGGFAFLGMLGGALFGISVGILINMLLGFLCPPLSLLGLTILLSTSAIVGGVQASRGHSFFGGMTMTLGGSIIAMSLFSLIMMPILVAAVPALTLPAALAGFSFALPFLPAVLLLMGGVAEIFSPGKLYEVFETLVTAPMIISAIIFGVIGFAFGSLIELCRFGGSARNRSRNQRNEQEQPQPQQNQAPRPEEEPEPRAEARPEGVNQAGIERELGQARNDDRAEPLAEAIHEMNLQAPAQENVVAPAGPEEIVHRGGQPQQDQQPQSPQVYNRI